MDCDPKQNEEELSQLIDGVPQHVFVLEANGSRRYSNRVGRDYHGLGADDPQDDHLATFVHLAARSDVLALRQRLIDAGEPMKWR